MDSKQLNEEIEDLKTDPVDRLLQEKKPASSGKGVAILALLVALAAVGASGWQWWQTRLDDPADTTQKESMARLQDVQQQLANSVASFEAQLDAAESPLDAAEFSRRDERLRAVESQLGNIQGQSGEDKASMSALQGSVRSLEQRLSATESGLATVAASSQNSSVELDIAEIDFLLRVANERLHLFADPSAADLALQAADVQIEALNDPMFLSVRQRLASARQDLAAVPRVDRVQLSARLSDMQSEVPGLPFRGEATAQPEPVLAEDAGWWESLKHTLSSLVTVRRRVPEDQSLLSLDDKDYLRQGLWLQLESSRLALMRNDAGAYGASLGRVNDTLEQFFHNGSSEVQALLLEVAALKEVNIAPAMPDISAPWTQLRQLRDSRRLLQSAAPVESGDSIE
jgi:uroporphyrin-3 C-methyltransferase